MNKVAVALVIIGALNWLCIGLFTFDFVSAVFGGQAAVVSRIIFALVGLAGIWLIPSLFKRLEPAKQD